MQIEQATSYRDCLVGEAIEICLHPNNFNREEGFTLSWAWQPITKLLKQKKEVLKEKQGQAQQSVDSTHLPYWCVSFHLPWPGTAVYSGQPGCQVISWPSWWRRVGLWNIGWVNVMWLSAREEFIAGLYTVFSNVMKHDQFLLCIEIPIFLWEWKSARQE
jgi:hypothetical protein